MPEFNPSEVMVFGDMDMCRLAVTSCIDRIELFRRLGGIGDERAEAVLANLRAAESSILDAMEVIPW